MSRARLSYQHFMRRLPSRSFRRPVAGSDRFVRHGGRFVLSSRSKIKYHLCCVFFRRDYKSMNRTTSLFLDLVRLLAALVVLLHHAAFHGTYIPGAFIRTGTDAVMVFFVLSGFVISYSAETKDKTGKDFTISRLARLLSVVIPAIFLTIVADIIGSRLSPELYARHFSDIATLNDMQWPPLTRSLLSLTFTNEIWWINVWPGTNSPFWSMGYEAAYYFIFGAATYLTGWQRYLVCGTAAAVIGPKIILLFPVWLIGVTTWQIYKRIEIPRLIGALLITGAGTTYVVFVLSGLRDYLNTRGPSLEEFGFSAFFLSDYIIGMLFSCALIGFKGIETDAKAILDKFAFPIRHIAGCSFSMYLYHYPLIYFFHALAISLHISSPESRSPFNAFVVMGGTLSSIWLLSLFTEQKKATARRLLEFLFASKRTKNLNA
ncbi:MAG: acyltransferase family protein [Rhodopseudomonas sp.]|nr:acyltransferase family protein [Rhodopseudomonas sp.]